MSKGELLTRITIWITLAGYFLGAGLIAVSLRRPDLDRYLRLARWVWTVACLSLLVHVAFAYHFYHQWSQDSVYRETARQTAEVTGINWGGGVYFNYVLMIGWIIDVAWWWRGLERYRNRSTFVTLLWHSFLLVMVFNAMAVFKTGTLRFIGTVLSLTLFTLWLYSGVRKSSDEFIQQ